VFDVRNFNETLDLDANFFFFFFFVREMNRNQ